MIGTITFAAGVILIMRHLHVWRLKSDATSDESQKRFLWLQLRRRVLTSLSIAVLGIVIALLNLDWTPIPFTILVCAALVLTFMIFIMASLDMLAVSQAVRLDENKSGEAARKLVQEYRRLKQKSDDSQNDRSDGSSDTNV